MHKPDNHPIKNLSISEYKSIKNLDNLEFKALNVIIGANGSGKTNLLSYITTFYCDTVVRLYADARIVAPFLQRLKSESPGSYKIIRNTIRLALPFFDDFLLETPTDTQKTRLLWKQRNDDYTFLPEQLSDGSLRFMCLVAALQQPNPPTTLVIDAPELSLHPYAITLLGALLRSASHHMQIIITTQSASLLDEFSIDDLILCERKDGASVFKRLNESKLISYSLEEYSLGELWEQNLLGDHP